MVVSKISSEKSIPFGMKYSQQEMSRKMFGDVIIARQTRDIIEPVSYTHLTLPTIA